MREAYTVLVVEDEPRMRELLVRAVGGWGFVTTPARSGEEALRLMEEQPRRIVLLDLNLPGIGGMDVFRQVRQRWPRTQVVVLTGFGDLEAARKAIHLDVVEFLTKPCHLGELERALDRARRRIEEAEPLPTVPLAEESAEPEDASPAPEVEVPPPGSGARLDEVERQHILAALARHHGNRAAAAAELGISLRTLYYRLSEYQKQGFEIE